MHSKRLDEFDSYWGLCTKTANDVPNFTRTALGGAEVDARGKTGYEPFSAEVDARIDNKVRTLRAHVGNRFKNPSVLVLTTGYGPFGAEVDARVDNRLRALRLRVHSRLRALRARIDNRLRTLRARVDNRLRAT